jgi:hypothetical protein
MKNIIKIASLTLLASVLAVTCPTAHAQDASTNAPAMTSTNATTTVHKKKGAALPFHGSITAIDASAGTFSVKTLNFTVTSKTKISTNNVPATLADFKVGDNVTGAYKKAADGTLTATTLKLGGAKKKKTADTAQ